MIKDIATVSLVLLVFILIFVIIMQIVSMRNLKKSRSHMEKLQALLKPGSKVILLGGIYGRVIKMSEDTAIVNISKDVDIKVDRSAIKEVVT